MSARSTLYTPMHIGKRVLSQILPSTLTRLSILCAVRVTVAGQRGYSQ